MPLNGIELGTEVAVVENFFKSDLRQLFIDWERVNLDSVQSSQDFTWN